MIIKSTAFFFATASISTPNFEFQAPFFQLYVFVRQQANMSLGPNAVSHADGDTSLNPSDANATLDVDGDITLSPGYANETALEGTKGKGKGKGKGANSNWVVAAVHNVETVAAVMQRWHDAVTAALNALPQAKGGGKGSNGGA